MLDWFLVSCGGAAVYAASRWLKARVAASKGSKQQRIGKYGQPLRLVVAQCEARWFLQELQLAMAGDAEAMVRVSHMLMAGYGTQQDHTAAARWMRQAWAIQNYKEPGQLHDMLDVRDSAIPALNDAAGKPAGKATVHPAATAAAPTAGNTSSSSRSRRGGGGTNRGQHSSSSSNAAGPAAAAADSSGAAAGGFGMQAAVNNSSSISSSHGYITEAGIGGKQPAVQLSCVAVVATQPCTPVQQQQQQPALQPAQQFAQQNAEHQQQPVLQQQQQQSQRQHAGLASAGRTCRKLLRQQLQQQRIVAVASAAKVAQQQQLQQQQAGVAALSVT